MTVIPRSSCRPTSEAPARNDGFTTPVRICSRGRNSSIQRAGAIFAVWLLPRHAFDARAISAQRAWGGQRLVEQVGHIRLTSHLEPGAVVPASTFGARARSANAPIVATAMRPADCNAIGAHGGAYGVYRALAVAGAMTQLARPDHEYASRRADRPSSAMA
ncbi:MAG: hypothetical protein U1E30_02955 [Rhodoblastus sp.]